MNRYFILLFASVLTITNFTELVYADSVSVLMQHMMMEDEAKRAIMELNGCMLNGNRLNVEVPEESLIVM